MKHFSKKDMKAIKKMLDKRLKCKHGEYYGDFNGVRCKKCGVRISDNTIKFEGF
jgi:hypothetical protein